jgi:hypothetical protein
MTRKVLINDLLASTRVYITLASVLLAYQGLAQQTISRTNEKVILESARQTVSNYTKYLELLSQETDKDIIGLYQAELYKSVQRDSVNVFNDLTPLDERSQTLRENIDRLPTYLNDINTRYLEGVKIVYSNFVASKVFIDAERSRLFVKITADRAIDGVYYNKNQKKVNEGTEKIDFYIKVELKASGVPESKIYSIFLYESNESKFTPIKVVEKTAAIEFVRMPADTVLKRATEHTIAWSGGEIFERLRLDLYKEVGDTKTKVADLDTSFVNDNKVKFMLTKKIKPGKRNRYFFQLTKLSSEEQPVRSENFIVKRKTPLILKWGVPILITGGVVYLLMNPKEEAKDPVLPGPESPQ